ncbi:HAMP domain-containing histidine kinase [Paenibacillus albidus]|uniref:HAMP domain-containing sensor histidine kinase n=1 Tax=Paenibacillus albidus TaxID=2041023 RepID=UPI001BEA1210|nr:HAMP domain-containing sensor histidine kinase [Paenibacillus albidus]MBT2292722.1 HAMP domain-containing histidine kinase [Paenibacillus albidus]
MGKLRRGLRNLSIKKTFMLYMLVFSLAAVFLSFVSIQTANNVQDEIFYPYAAGRIYSSEDERVINICDFVQTWSIPIYSGLCIMGASSLFYRNKLKKPIQILSLASAKISNNDLDFYIQQDSKDEMGRLCGSFEKMRASLDENNRQMWRSMEERKQLNAAFSHDLRTPLTVLRGYADFLSSYLPQGKVSQEKVISTLATMSTHILRLENYVQRMGETQKLEDTYVSVSKVKVELFLEQLHSTTDILASGQSFNISYSYEINEAELNMDVDLVARVFENMLSNAIRYVHQSISIHLGLISGMLSITVSDDGPGFSKEELEEATNPFYKSKTNGSDVHFGLGLHICRVLAGKHGGGIELANNENGGASVTAKFQVKS